MYKNPYENLSGGSWLKTNFHTHAGTGEGCGKNPIEPTLELYKFLGYGAVCISNHDLYTDTKAMDDGKMLLVQGVEYSQKEHMLTVGIEKSLHELEHQAAIDETKKLGGFVILCHPNWLRKGFWPNERLDELNGYAGIEVINMLIYRLSGSGLATEQWDYLLRQGRLVYGFGNDDFHMPFDAGRSFNDIYANESNFAAIKEAVDNGRFTASTGLRLEYLTLEGNVIRAKASFEKPTFVNTFTYRVVTENGVAKEFCGEELEFALNGENYARVEVIAENGMMLFTQPVYKVEAFKK